MRFEPVQLHLQEGDVLTSKLGILQVSAVSERAQLVHRLKYLGNGMFEVLGEKRQFIDITPVKEEKTLKAPYVPGTKKGGTFVKPGDERT